MIGLSTRIGSHLTEGISANTKLNNENKWISKQHAKSCQTKANLCTKRQGRDQKKEYD